MKILSIFLLIGALTLNGFSLPLVFKTTKEIKASGELITLDTSKYKRLRLGMFLIGGTEGVQSDIRIEAVEDSDYIFISTFFVHSRFRSRSVSIEDPPSKIRVSSDVAGTYKIFIWAE